MKKFKVRASYQAMCETEVEANNIDEAYEIAKKLDGSVVYDSVIGVDVVIALPYKLPFILASEPTNNRADNEVSPIKTV